MGSSAVPGYGRFPNGEPNEGTPPPASALSCISPDRQWTEDWFGIGAKRIRRLLLQVPERIFVQDTDDRKVLRVKPQEFEVFWSSWKGSISAAGGAGRLCGHFCSPLENVIGVIRGFIFAGIERRIIDNT